jgi:microcystin-dependent protein
MRKSFSGNAVPTTLTAPALASDTSLTVGATTNFPNTTVGPFVVCLNRGYPSEEKVLISGFTSTVLTVASGGRGYDGTTAIGHAAGETVTHSIDANTIDFLDGFAASNGTVTPHASAIGDTASDGTSSAPAAADHKHARESFATGATTNSAPGDTAGDGSSASPARADHKHGREAGGGGGGGGSGSGRVGEVAMWAGGAAPTNAFLCQGQAISRTTYATLFGVIGVTFGAGDGSTTFNLPDMQGRVAVGAGTGAGLTARTEGGKGGEEGHVQVIGEMPSHDHGYTEGATGHAHLANAGGNTSYQAVFTNPGVSGNVIPGGSGVTGAGSAPVYVIFNPSFNTDAHKIGIAIDAEGGGAAANVMQPYLVTNFIIYAL